MRSRMSLSSGDVVWAGVGAATTAGAGFLFAWIVARALGPAGSGVVMAFATWVTALIVVGKMGMDTALVWACARSTAGTEPATPASLLRWALVPALALTMAIAIFVGVNAEWLAPLALDDAQGADLELIVRIGAVALPLAVATLLILSAVRGVGYTRPLVIVDQIVKPVVRLGAAVLVLMVGAASIDNMVWSWLAAIPLCLVLAAQSLRHVRHPAPATSGPLGGNTGDASTRRDLYRFAGPRSVAQIADIASASAGILILSTLGTATETGLFAAALRLAAGGLLALQAVRLVVAPVLAHELTLNRRDSAQLVYGSSATLITVLSWPVFLLMAAAPTLVLGIYGPEFEAAWPSLVIMAVGWMLISALGNMQAAVLMSGASSWGLWATLLGLVANLAFTLALLSLLGATAAAIGWLAGALVEASMLWVGVRRLGLRPAPRRVVKAALLAAVILLPTWAAMSWLWFQSLPLALGVAVLGCSVYLVAIRPTAVGAWRDLTAERRSLGKSLD